MAPENIKSIMETRKKNQRSLTEKDYVERKLEGFFWINEKFLNELENSPGQVASFHIKHKGLNNSNHQIQQENSHLMERLGQF